MTACLIDGMRMHRICLVGRRPHTKGIASLCLLGVLCTAVPAAAQTMPEPVRLALKKAGIPHDAVALAAAPVVPDGAPRVRVGADRPVNPASVMKLVTTYAALDVLGPTFTWHTQFLADGAASDGLLRGNLYVRGGGDPKFVMERIAVALQAVRDAGISVVHGDMVLDQSAFQLPRVDPSAFDGERLRPYNASPEALLINFKSVILKVTPDPGAGVARIAHEPPLAGLAVDTTVPLGTGHCADWRTGLQARFDQPTAIRMVGRYPAACGQREWPVAYVDPDSYAERALEGMWRASGGLLTGRVRTGPVSATARPVHDAPSLPLADIVGDINKFSNNVMAQQLFLTLGRLPTEAVASTNARTPTAVATFERSRAWVGRWWRNRFGASVAEPALDNGSGLSRDERITADALLALLRDAAAHPTAGTVLLQSLPVAGVDGTATRMGERGIMKTALGNARIKTGSLRDVAAVAGYVTTQGGTPWAVVGIVNHPNASQSRPALDALLEWVANQPR
jgi:D-alanyl-D-alanine carboxypeptidase/D-alanyl-D-alanine-endopeptidase (penicillin-binding protein 4)